MGKVLRLSMPRSASGQAHCLAEYLALLHAKAEGRSEAEMAREILGIDPQKEPARAKRAVQSSLKRAQWLADNPQALLAEAQPRASKSAHRSKPK